jgi:hypothetical protein
MESKLETAVTAPAITASTVPPATRERRRFLSEGVTAASATRGLTIIVATAAVTPAVRASCLLVALQKSE